MKKKRKFFLALILGINLFFANFKLKPAFAEMGNGKNESRIF